MTYLPALTKDAWVLDAEADGIEEIASIWAVLEAMEDYPATVEGKCALQHYRLVFHDRLAAAGITEADLLAQLQGEMTEPLSRLRAVVGPPPDN